MTSAHVNQSTTQQPITVTSEEGATASETRNNTCPICMDRQRDVVFICGHGTCEECSKSLRKCHICRKKIKRVIKIYS